MRINCAFRKNMIQERESFAKQILISHQIVTILSFEKKYKETYDFILNT